MAGLSPAEHASLHWTHNRTGGFPASGSRTRLHACACNAFCSFWTFIGVDRFPNLQVLHYVLRLSLSEVPSLHRYYPASAVLRSSPPLLLISFGFLQLLGLIPMLIPTHRG